MWSPTIPTSPFGKYLRTQRKAAFVSQLRLAKAIGVSHSYVSEVELGQRPPFDPRLWPAIVKMLPGTTIADLQRAAAQTRPLEIDLSKATAAQADLALAVALRLGDGSLDDTEAAALLDQIRGAAVPPVRAYGRVVDAAGTPVPGRAYVYRLVGARGWTALAGQGSHDGFLAGPVVGRAALLVGQAIDLLTAKDPRGAGFFDVPGGLPPGDYALDVHHVRADGTTADDWAYPFAVTEGAPAQDVRIVAPTTTPQKNPPDSGGGATGGSGSGGQTGGDGGKPPPGPTGPLPPAPALAKQFTAGTFTAAFSYYGLGGAPLDRIRRDLDRIRAAGFAHARVWVDWERPTPASRILDRSGKLISPQADKLDAALEYAQSLGLSFDFTFETSHYDATQKSGEGYDITNHKNAVRAVLTRWGQHPSLRIVDLDNEAEVRGAGGHGSPDTGHTSPGRFTQLMDVARSVKRTCLVSASVSFSVDGMPKDMAELFRDVKGEILLPHFKRSTGWGATEGPNAKELAKALPGIPIHHQEPGRNGHDTTPPGGWPLSEFEASFRTSKAAGSLGCCFHTGAAFDLTQKDAWDQLDATEREVVAHVVEWVK